MPRISILDFDDSTIEKFYLDVTSDESVQDALKHIIQREDEIDVVVNNAGLLVPGTRPLVEQSLDHVKQIFDTNGFSILRVCLQGCCAFHGKASLGDHRERWFDRWRNAAVSSISEVLSMELKPFNISVLHVAPGAVKSKIASNAIKRFALALDSLYPDLLWYIIKGIEVSQDAPMPSKDFAQGVVSNVL